MEGWKFTSQTQTVSFSNLASNHPTRLNEYVHSGGMPGEEDMGSDRNPDKIEVSKTVPNFQPPLHRNPVSIRKKMNPPTTRNSSFSMSGMTRQDLADGVLKDSVEQIQPGLPSAEEVWTVATAIRRKSCTSLFPHEGPCDSSQMSAHLYEKLVLPKNPPLQESISSIFGSETSLTTPCCPKAYKKIHSRSIPAYQNDHISSCIESAVSGRHHRFSSSPEAADCEPFEVLPHCATNGREFEARLAPARTDFCENCSVTRDPIKDFEWGWLIPSRNLQCSEHSLPNRCSRHFNMVSNTRYMNDGHFLSAHNATFDSSLEVVFTVLLEGGRSLKFSIAHTGGRIHFQHDAFADVFGSDVEDMMTSLLHQEQQGGEPKNDGQFASASTSSWYGRPQHDNRLTMTPNLTPAGTTNTKAVSGKQQASETILRKGRGRFEIQETVISSPEPPTGAFQKSPHFELSMASYSKLIAYCGSMHGGQQMPGLHRQYPRQSLSERQWPKGDAASTSTGQVDDLCRLAKVFETVEHCTWYWGAMSGQEAKEVLRDAKPGTFLLRDSSDSRHLFSLSVKTAQGPTSIRIVCSDGAFRFDSEMDDPAARRWAQQQDRNSRASDTEQQSHPNYVKRVTPVFTCVIKMVLYHTKLLGYISPKSRVADVSKATKIKCPKCLTNFPETQSGFQRTSRNPQNTGLSHPEQFMCYWVNRGGRQEIPVLLSAPMSSSQLFPPLQRLCRQALSVSLKLWDREDIVDGFPLPNSLKKYIKRYPYPV